MNVLVTGAGGNLGRLLVSKLSSNSKIKKIIGVDLKEPKPIQKLKFYKIDIRDKNIRKIFQEEKVDTVIHLAFMLVPMYDTKKQWDINVLGSQNIFFISEESKVKKIVFASSTNAYGAHPDNPIPLTEEHPLRPNPDVQYTVEKMICEGMLNKIQERNPKMIVTILRPCTIVGPHIKNPLLNIMKKTKMKSFVTFIGYNPALQFVHEEDVTQAFYQAVIESHPGIFNVVPDDYIDITIAKEKGYKIFWLHFPTAKFFANVIWKLRLFNTAPATLDLIRYSWVASNEKIRKEWGFKFNYTTDEALLSVLKT